MKSKAKFEFRLDEDVCRKAAEALGLQFKLIINEQPII